MTRHGRHRPRDDFDILLVRRLRMPRRRVDEILAADHLLVPPGPRRVVDDRAVQRDGLGETSDDTGKANLRGIVDRLAHVVQQDGIEVVFHLRSESLLLGSGMRPDDVVVAFEQRVKGGRVGVAAGYDEQSHGVFLRRRIRGDLGRQGDHAGRHPLNTPRESGQEARLRHRGQIVAERAVYGPAATERRGPYDWLILARAAGAGRTEGRCKHLSAREEVELVIELIVGEKTLRKAGADGMAAVRPFHGKGVPRAVSDLRRLPLRADDSGVGEPALRTAGDPAFLEYLPVEFAVGDAVKRYQPFAGLDEFLDGGFRRVTPPRAVVVEDKHIRACQSCRCHAANCFEHLHVEAAGARKDAAKKRRADAPVVVRQVSLPAKKQNPDSLRRCAAGGKADGHQDNKACHVETPVNNHVAIPEYFPMTNSLSSLTNPAGSHILRLPAELEQTKVVRPVLWSDSWRLVFIPTRSTAPTGVSTSASIGRSVTS